MHLKHKSQVVVSDVFSDEIVENILDGILEQAVHKDTPVHNQVQGEAVLPQYHTVQQTNEPSDLNEEYENVEDGEINLDLSEVGMVKVNI